MNWSSLETALLGTLLGGLVLIVIALVLHRVAPQWAGFKTLLMLGGAVMMAPVLAWALEGIYWLADWPFVWVGDWVGTIHNAFGERAQAFLTWIGAKLPWMTFGVLALLLVLALYPRFKAFREAQGIGGKFGAVHKAGHNTLWIALSLPAAAVIVIAPGLIANPVTLMQLAGK